MIKQIENEILNKISQYAQSIDEVDLNLASELWLNSDEVTFIHPRWHEHGLEEIQHNFYIKTMKERFSKRKLTVFDIKLQTYHDTVVAEFYWDFVAQFRDTGETHLTKGRETQVFVRTSSGEWRLVHIHYSSMPVTGDREGF